METSIANLVKTEFIEILQDPSKCFGFYDWFCKDSSLKNNKRFDPNTTYVFFKNNCPCNGGLYDDFRICDIETGSVLYTVTPRDPHEKGKASVWSYENDFEEPLIIGSWVEVKKFFASAA